jgi:hypothetical protein
VPNTANSNQIPANPRAGNSANSNQISTIPIAGNTARSNQISASPAPANTAPSNQTSATPHISLIIVFPNSVAPNTPGYTLTLTGTRTSWTPGVPGSPIFTASAGFIEAQRVDSATSATIIYSSGAPGTVNIFDPTTGNSTSLEVVAATPIPNPLTTLQNDFTVTGNLITGQNAKVEGDLIVGGTIIGGGGSGGINPGDANNLAYYAATGTAVSPLSLGNNLSITSGVLNAAGGGGGSPGGLAGQIQVNSDGTAFSGLTGTVWTSAIIGSKGDVVFSPGASTYTVDYTIPLQNLINTYVGSLIIWDGKYSHSGLVFPSNTQILFLPGCGDVLRANSNVNMWQNSVLSRGIGGHQGTTQGGSTAATLGNFGNTNIILQGGIHDCNFYHNTSPGVTTFLHGTQFWGVQTLICKELTFYDGNLWFANCQYFHGYDISSITSGSAVPFVGGPSGPQINGPAQFGYFDTITVQNGLDDIFSINADDGFQTNPDLIYPFPGSITDIEVRNITSNETWGGIRFLSAGTRIDRISIKGVRGEFETVVAYLDNFLFGGTSVNGTGNFGAILIEDVAVNVNQIGQGTGEDFPSQENNKALFFIEAAGGDISLVNWRLNSLSSTSTTKPMIYVSGLNGFAKTNRIRLDNFSYYEPNPTNTIPILLCLGAIGILEGNATVIIADTVGPTDAPIVRVSTGNSSVGIDTIDLIVNTRNVDSVLELTSGLVETCKLIGRQTLAGGNAAVTVASGAVVTNLDTTQLLALPVSGKKWSGSGTVTNDIDNGGTYSGP